MGFAYLEKNYRLIAADFRAIQQIIFTGTVKPTSMIYDILEQLKEKILEFYNRTAKVLWIVSMVEYSTVGVTLSSSQLNKLKTAAKNQTGVALRINIKMLKRNNLSHELLLTARQKTKLRNAFENNMSTDIKLSRAQISKISQSRWILGSLLSKLAGPLMKVAAPLAKNILTPVGILAAASAIDAEVEKKIHGSGDTTLIVSNDELYDIMKIVQALEDSNILLKGVTKTIKNKTKEQKEDF